MLFVAGLFVGTLLGMMIHSMLTMAKWSDEMQESQDVKADIQLEGSRLGRR